MKLKTNRGSIKTTDWGYEYRDFLHKGYHRSFKATTQEKRKWFDYISQMSQLGLPHSNRRAISSIPDDWNIEPVAYPQLVNPRS